jgi:hypothetical protein
MNDLFDSESMNLVNWNASLAEALESVRETIEERGVEAIATWALIPEDTGQLPIRGEQLVKQALEYT